MLFNTEWELQLLTYVYLWENLPYRQINTCPVVVPSYFQNHNLSISLPYSPVKKTPLHPQVSERFGLDWLLFNVSVNNFSVMLGQSHWFLDILYQYFRELIVSCSRTKHGDRVVQTLDLSLQSPTLYHWATPPYLLIFISSGQCFLSSKFERLIPLKFMVRNDCSS